MTDERSAAGAPAADQPVEMDAGDGPADGAAANDLGDVPGPRRGRLRRTLGLVGRIPHPTPSSRRGLFLLFVLVAGFGAALTVGGVAAIAWTDSPEFCAQCHVMAPQVKAYEASAHNNVDCVECHTEPGLEGWLKAKMNGTRQLIEVLTSSYPQPIPVPDHAALPPVTVTCLRCHNVEPLIAQNGPIKLVVHDRYASDEGSTRQTVAFVLRPAGFGGLRPQVGVHWHIGAEVDFWAADTDAQQIDYVSVTRDDGSREQFMAIRAVTQLDNVDADITRLGLDDAARRMDCIDCHNRVGHEVPTLDNAIDAEITAGSISSSLPLVKRQALERLSADYASLDNADLGIEGLREFYAGRYPLVARERATEVERAVDTLKTLYRLVATPEMRVSATTYPNNIGHQDAPGCFRCHDGAHYKVERGTLTSETIPSQCSTCHTFPQIGQVESGVLIGNRPASHDSRLWVFEHRYDLTTAAPGDPSGQTCSSCHTRTYCENCHATPAVQVTHDGMATAHASIIREVGAQTCAFCHAPAYCAQCHAEPVMPEGNAGTGDLPVVPDESDGRSPP